MEEKDYFHQQDQYAEKELLSMFAEFLQLEKGLSDNSEKSYLSDLKLFFQFLKIQELSLTQFTEDDVREYIELRNEDGLDATTIKRYLAAFKAYVKFMRLEDLRDDNPLLRIRAPKVRQSLPLVLSEKAVEAFLNAPDLSTHIGVRDKAMLELLYACGLRVSELCNIKFSDLHIADRYIIIQGKGEKQRLVPLTDIAIYWINEYVSHHRNLNDPEGTSPYIFLSSVPNSTNTPLTRLSFWRRIKIYSKQIGLAKEPSPHTFRHAFATHLLNHDVDLRSLQMLLGHASLTTTQIYTHVALARMHVVYDKAHPRA